MRGMHLLQVFTLVALSTNVDSQPSPNCNRRLNGFLCQACRAADAEIIPAYKIGPGGPGGACQSCTSVFCGQVPNITDPTASKDETTENCPRTLSDSVVRNAVLDSSQLLEIAKANPYVAVTIFGQQFGDNEMNPAGLGGTTAFAKSMAMSDVQTLIQNPLAVIGSQMPASTGVLVEASEWEETPSTITFEYRATQISILDETRTQEGQRVRLTFQKKPLQSRIVGQAPAFTYHGLRLIRIDADSAN